MIDLLSIYSLFPFSIRRTFAVVAIQHIRGRLSLSYPQRWNRLIFVLHSESSACEEHTDCNNKNIQIAIILLG